MIDLKLDPLTWDLAIEGGDLVIISGAAETVQHIGIRLRTIVREWFLDPTQGFLDLKRMFGKNAPEHYFRSKLIAEIESVAQVVKGSVVIERLVYTSATHNRSVTWTAKHVNGEALRATQTAGLA